MKQELLWNNIFSSREWGKYPSESLIRFIARNFYSSNRSNVKILEIGCGTGANIWYMSREGFDVYGVDFSESGIEIAKNRLVKENLKANLLISDVSNLNYDDNFFDAVIDCECIYANNFESSKKILLEINRVLKSGGFFYSRSFAEDMFIGNPLIKYNDFEYDKIQSGSLAGKGFTRLIDENGIKKLYGEFFNIVSIDFLKYSNNNQEDIVSEYIIISQKNE